MSRGYGLHYPTFTEHNIDLHAMHDVHGVRVRIWLECLNEDLRAVYTRVSRSDQGVQEDGEHAQHVHDLGLLALPVGAAVRLIMASQTHHRNCYRDDGCILGLGLGLLRMASLQCQS
jgi:hypothetical protein